MQPSPAITSVAALNCGVITPDSVLYDPGYFKIGALTLHNAGNVSNGALALRRALQVSSDVFFYQLGADLNSACGGTELQKWAHKLGIGRQTGIDLPGEGKGFLPTPNLINHLHKVEPTVNVQFSEIFWERWLDTNRPTFWLTRELPGILLVLGYLAITPMLLAKTVCRKMVAQMGTPRYLTMMVMFLTSGRQQVPPRM